jgi:hypothetical protein
MVALRILLGMTQSAIFPGLSYLISTVRLSCLLEFGIVVWIWVLGSSSSSGTLAKSNSSVLPSCSLGR